MGTSGVDLSLLKQEAVNLEEKFKDPQFMKLLDEYFKERQDPKVEGPVAGSESLWSS